MSKEKVQDVTYEEVKDIEAEVEEAHAEMDAKKKEKIPVKDHIKTVGKEGLKYLVGGLLGFGAAIAVGCAMNKSNESYEDDYDLLEEGDESEEMYDEE